MERETRFELATSTLARLHSTTELFPQFYIANCNAVYLNGAGNEIRTRDVNLGKVALYH